MDASSIEVVGSQGDEDLVATREAAAILNVHESSIKRWCNSGQLPASLTRGRHRRISLVDLLHFARSKEIATPLLFFAPVEREVWFAVQQAVDGDFEAVRLLFLRFLGENENEFARRFILLLLDYGISVDLLCDNVFGPVLVEIGDRWCRGLTTVGDEHRMSQIIIDCINSIRWRRTESSRSANVAVVACAPGGSHELGAQMVRMYLEEKGWQVVYLGQNVPVEDVIRQQVNWRASLVCVSIVPPHGSADAAVLIRGLTRLYDPERPFALAVGGGNVFETGGDEGHPFLDTARFSSLSAFGDWIAETFWQDAGGLQSASDKLGGRNA